LVACDNASPNDKMIMELIKLLKCFPGAANRVHCFLHIINFVMQAILKQFDLPKKKLKDAPATDLEMLAGDIENEEATTRRDFEGGQDDEDDGEFDPHAGMDVGDEEDLDNNLQPVHMVLVKVTITCLIGCVILLTAAQLCRLVYAIKNSRTHNLP